MHSVYIYTGGQKFGILTLYFVVKKQKQINNKSKKLCLVKFEVSYPDQIHRSD